MYVRVCMCLNCTYKPVKCTLTETQCKTGQPNIILNLLLYIFVWYLSYLPNPSARAGYDTRSIFKQSLTGFNSEFSFSKTSCLPKAEEPRLPYHLPIAGGRIIGFILFPRVLVLCEMQSVSSRIWTRVTVSISYDDNYYTTSTSYLLDIYLLDYTTYKKTDCSDLLTDLFWLKRK